MGRDGTDLALLERSTDRPLGLDHRRQSTRVESAWGGSEHVGDAGHSKD